MTSESRIPFFPIDRNTRYYDSLMTGPVLSTLATLRRGKSSQFTSVQFKMAIKLKYEELLQDDDLTDDLMKNTKDTKKDFDSLQCKCELLEEGGDEDDGEISWNEIGNKHWHCNI